MTDLFSFVDAVNRNSPLYQKFCGALSEFLGSLDQTQYVTILLCGSLARNRIKPESDIDVFLVLPPGSTAREDFREVECGGVPIQLFSSTEADLQGACSWERTSSSRQRSSLVAHGVAVSGDRAVAARMIQQARESWEAPPPSMDLQNAKSMINFIDNQFPEAMERLYSTSRHGFLMTWNGMMDRYFHLIHQRESKLLPRHNEIDADLSSIDDRELGRAYCTALAAHDLTEKKRLFFELSGLIRSRLASFVEARESKGEMTDGQPRA